LEITTQKHSVSLPKQVLLQVGYRLKIVERAGDSLEGLLHKSNPWSGADCAREKCLLCETKQSHPQYENQRCSKRNVVYETWCETCRLEDEKTTETETDGKKRQQDVKLFKYIGESRRSCFERGLEHQNDCQQLKPSSHMLKHILDRHEGQQPGDIKFLMKAVKFHHSAFERQIHEAVLIQANRAHHLLNSKSEYNRCALPRLGTKLGERETREKREEVEEEEKREQELEEKIRNLRKERQRLRKNTRQENQPKRKKQKLDDECDKAVEEMIGNLRRGEKRKDKQLDVQEFVEQAREKKRRKLCEQQLLSKSDGLVRETEQQLPSQDALVERVDTSTELSRPEFEQQLLSKCDGLVKETEQQLPSQGALVERVKTSTEQSRPSCEQQLLSKNEGLVKETAPHLQDHPSQHIGPPLAPEAAESAPHPEDPH
jgi:hypothetical protein